MKLDLQASTNIICSSCMYKAALKTGFYDFTSARDFYREATKAAGTGMHQDLVKQYIKLQALLLTPIAPHWSEYMWRDVLHESTSIQNALYPTVPEPQVSLTIAREYVRQTSSNITSAEGAQQKKLAKGKAVTFDPKKEKKLTVFAAKNYPAWQDQCIELVREAFNGLTVDVKQVSQKLDKSQAKKAMSFVQVLKKRLEGGESKETVFERNLGFDELDVLREMVAGLKQSLQKCTSVEIVSVAEGGKTGTVVAGTDSKEGAEVNDLPQAAELAVPGAPTFHFENV